MEGLLKVDACRSAAIQGYGLEGFPLYLRRPSQFAIPYHRRIPFPNEKNLHILGLDSVPSRHFLLMSVACQVPVRRGRHWARERVLRELVVRVSFP